MQRLLGPLIVVAGVLLAGAFSASEVFAAEPNLQPTLMMLTESESHETSTREHVIIITSPDLLTTPLFQSLFSSYVQTDLPLGRTDATGIRNLDENRRDAQSPVATDGTGTLAGGTDSVRTPAQRPGVGDAGGVNSPTTLELSELLPNTSGDDAKDEYITIRNTGGQAVDLTGWSFSDASGKTFTFDKGTVAPGTILKVPRTQSGITLNNDTDTVSLISPDKQLIDSTSYEKTKPDDRFVRDGAVWRFASQVPAAQPASAPGIPLETVGADKPVSDPAATQNPPQSPLGKGGGTQSQNPPQSPLGKGGGTQTNNSPQSPSKKGEGTRKTPSSVASLDIAGAKQKPDDAWVEVMGTASVAPGVLGKQFFYIEDATGAVQVYKHDSVFPDITVGTSLTIRGQMSTNGQERRLKVPKDGSIKVNGAVETIQPSERNISELFSVPVGLLVKTSGILVSATSDELEIEQNGQMLSVVLPSSANIDLSSLKAGARLQVTGIVRPYGDKVKLSARSQEDIVVLEEPTPAAAAGSIEPGKTTRERQDQLIAGIIAAASSAALVIWIVRQQIMKRHNTYASNTLSVSTETVH